MTDDFAVPNIRPCRGRTTKSHCHTSYVVLVHLMRCCTSRECTSSQNWNLVEIISTKVIRNLGRDKCRAADYYGWRYVPVQKSFSRHATLGNREYMPPSINSKYLSLFKCLKILWLWSRTTILDYTGANKSETNNLIIKVYKSLFFLQLRSAQLQKLIMVMNNIETVVEIKSRQFKRWIIIASHIARTYSARKSISSYFNQREFSQGITV